MKISNCKQWDSTLCISRLHFHSVLKQVHYYLVVTRLEKNGLSGHPGQADFPSGKALGRCLKDTEKLIKALLIKTLCIFREKSFSQLICDHWSLNNRPTDCMCRVHETYHSGETELKTKHHVQLFSFEPANWVSVLSHSQVFSSQAGKDNKKDSNLSNCTVILWFSQSLMNLIKWASVPRFTQYICCHRQP